jgi:hypothetical protein
MAFILKYIFSDISIERSSSRIKQTEKEVEGGGTERGECEGARDELRIYFALARKNPCFKTPYFSALHPVFLLSLFSGKHFVGSASSTIPPSYFFFLSDTAHFI